MGKPSLSFLWEGIIKTQATFKAYGVTDVGRVRENNEDSYALLMTPYTIPGVDLLLAVADGMGGHQAGEVASGHVTRRLQQLFSAGEEKTLAGAQNLELLLARTVETLNKELAELSASRPELRGMGTTATVAAVGGSRISIAHVGDSRAYLVRDGAIQALTQDHSWVAEEVRAGRLSPQEAASHPWRNIVTRALGTSVSVEVDTEIVALEPGDLVLLCSDGLHGVVSDAEIVLSW